MKGGSKSGASRARVASRTRKSATKSVSRKPASKPTAKKASGKRASAGGDADARVELARQMAALLDKHSLSELIVETGDLTLTMRRGVSSAAVMQSAPVHHVPAVTSAPAAREPAADAPATQPAAAAESTAHKVTSPFVGTFYRSPSPDADAYVKEGQRVEKGQVLCIVEAMKLMNEIEADQDGIISAILVQNAEPVEYGQALFEISPA